MNTPIVAIALIAVCAAGRAEAEGCWSGADRSLSLDAAGVTRVVIDAGAGELAIKGEPGRKMVDAKGYACASAERFLDEIRIDGRREGDTIYIDTEFPDIHEGLIGFTRYASLDLTVTVPDNVEIRLKDTSGTLRVSHVRAASIHDSSGEARVTSVAGNVEVGDSSGSIYLREIGGTVRVRDGSGDIDIDRVTGDVEILGDGSGSIEIGRVSGDVHVRADGSGQIDIENVQGNVSIERDGSGSIDVENVRGNFTVLRDGSGSIDYDRVKGKVKVPND